MTFASATFLLLLLPLAVLADLTLRRTESRNLSLALFSVLFYAFGEPLYVLLLLLCTLIHFHLAGALARRRSRGLLAAAVVFQLGVLCVLKYTPLPMPVGVSFWSFQLLSYEIDVYRGDVEPENDFVRLLLYVAFFPQLIAGPIVKYKEIRAQIVRRAPDAAAREAGLLLFLIGLSRKLVLADLCGELADAAFAASPCGTALAWLGAVAYCMQIYHDFAGYSDMACGLGLMFGFTLPENFRLPYAAGTIREFWRRWHVTLSSWFRDYLYVPLGGGRRGRARKILNLTLVFLATGLWHGADWTFVLWGLWHGAFRVLEEFVRPERNRVLKLVWRFVTLAVVLFGFVLFRAESLASAADYVRTMLTPVPAGAGLALAVNGLRLSALAVALVLSFVPLLDRARPPKLLKLPGAAVCAALLCLCVMRLVGSSYHPFIYFRF